MNLRLKLFIASIISSLILIVVFNYGLLNDTQTQINLPKHSVLKSRCACVTDKVEVNKFKDKYQITVEKNRSILLEYEIGVEAFKKLMLSCDLFSSLRRGFNQNIIGFSLFGKNKFYYDLLETNILAAKRHYPDWNIRVYHDDSIDKSEICKQQCLVDKKTNEMLNNLDYCNVNNVINENEIKYYNYMLPMAWRYF